MEIDPKRKRIQTVVAGLVSLVGATLTGYTSIGLRDMAQEGIFDERGWLLALSGVGLLLYVPMAVLGAKQVYTNTREMLKGNYSYRSIAEEFDE